MDTIDKLLKCKLCYETLKNPKILPCQHTFCYICLKGRADKDNKNQLECPTCFERFDIKVEDVKNNSFIDILLNLKTCGTCEKSETEEFCEECDQAFCQNCAQFHNKFKQFKDHASVSLYFDEQKIQSDLNIFCEDCDEFVDFKSIELHSKHELKNKEKGIEKRLGKWKEEIKQSTECRAEYGKSLITEEKWFVKKEELLKMKSQLEDDYKEFVEVVKSKKITECDKIDAEINKIEERMIKYKEQIKKEMFTLKEDKISITKKMKLIKRGSEEVLNDKSSYQLPPLLPPLKLQHHLAFKPSPMDALMELLPSIIDLKQLLTKEIQYELEGERTFETESGSVCHDGKYLYACCRGEHEIDVHSLDTLQLLQTIKCPEEFEPCAVVCVGKRFCVIRWFNDKMLLLDESGAVLSEVTLPEYAHRLQYNGSGKVTISCSDWQTVVSYDVDTRKLETVPTPSVEVIYQCFAMGGDEYCMEVQMNDGCWKIIKCVLGNIIQKYDVGEGIHDVFIKDGEWVFVLDDDNKKIHILDGDLQLISSLPIDSTGELDHISMDSEWNIHLSIWDSSEEFYNIRTYQLK